LKRVFGGFWCRNCGGRVFEDEPYRDGNGTWKAILTCLLCAKEHQCDLKDYQHLLENIRNIVTGQKGKGTKKSLLPQQRRSFS
jgi:hypothetical protein